MNHDKKLLGFYNYTVVLTYIGMLTGYAGIVKAFEGHSLASVLCLMGAGFCDMFDGTIASTMKRTRQEKNFGIQIDSLSDLVCFGVLPASLVYNLNKKTIGGMIISGFYVLCALIRLAYFNVDEAERQESEGGSRVIYYGLPVTMSAMFLPLVYGVVNLLSATTYISATVCLLAMAIMFLLPFKLKKPGKMGKILIVVLGLAEIAVVAFACMGV